MTKNTPQPEEKIITQTQFERLDKLCATLFEDCSRTKIQDFITQGLITVNGVIATDPSAIYKTPALSITLQRPPPKETHLKAIDMQLDIVFEDDHLLVINKPCGLVVHPAPGHDDDTLMNGLLAHCEENLAPVGGVLRPGLVHRLDKDTSGLMVIAKTDQAFYYLKEQFTDRHIKRKYYAFIWGLPNPVKDTITTHIDRHPIHRKKMTVSQNKGKIAITHYKTIENFNGKAALVQCDLETGRTHQIRVHLNHIGHSLIGDQIYQNKKHIAKHKIQDTLIHTFPRQALHAFSLEFIHPQTEEPMQFHTPLPQDLQQLHEHLKRIPFI